MQDNTQAPQVRTGEEDPRPWQRFAATGSVYDYLNYKSQYGGLGKESHANGDDGAGAAPGQGGRSGPDPDAFDA